MRRIGMVTSTIKAATRLFNNKYVVQTIDGGLYLSGASLSTTPTVGSIFNSEEFQSIGAGVGTYAVYDANTSIKSADIAIYVIGTATNTAYSYLLHKESSGTWTLSSPTKYLGLETTATAYNFYSGLDSAGNMLAKYSLPVNTSMVATPASLATALTPTVAISAGKASDTGNKIIPVFFEVNAVLPSYVLPTVPSTGTTPTPTVAKFNALLLTSKGQLYLYNSLSTEANITSNNALLLNMSSATQKAVSTALSATGVTPGVFLTQDAAQNFHITLTNKAASDAIAVNPWELVFNAQGQFQSYSKLDFAALNYTLDGVIGVGYGLDGKFSTAVQDLQYDTSSEGDQYGSIAAITTGEPQELQIAQVSYQTEAGLKSIGWVLSTAQGEVAVSAQNSYYLGANVSLMDIKSNTPAIFASGAELLLVWNSNTQSDPLYMKVTMQSSGAQLDRLTTEKLLAFEQSMGMDINGDQNIGTLSLIQDPSVNQAGDFAWRIQIAGSATPVVLYKLSNGGFFTPKQITYTPPASGVLGATDLQSLNAVSSSDLRSYEVRQAPESATYTPKDLNVDGIIGTVVESTVVSNDNFSLYKTTAGDIVYSALNGLTMGDSVSDAIGIAFSPSDQKALESSKLVVAAILQVRSGNSNANTLYVASQSQDALTGLTVLHENAFVLGLTNGLNSYLVPNNSPGIVAVNDYVYNNNTSDRLKFLSRELAYNFDLNNDGVIGDAVVRQLALNEQSAVYQTASGKVYITNNTLLNIGDMVDNTSVQLFDLSNAPDRIDAAIMTSSKSGVVFYSDINNSNNAGAATPDKHYTKTFQVGKTGQTTFGTANTLSDTELFQAEVRYKVDINGDEQLGDTIGRIIKTVAPIMPSTSGGVGLYALSAAIDPLIGANTPMDARNHVLIAEQSADAVAGDRQLNTDVYVLKNAQGSASLYWQLPIYNKVLSTVVAEGIFQTGANNAVDIVLKDSTKNNYYLVSFDATGATTKPNGTLLTPYALYNEEIKLQQDIDGDNNIGDSVSKVASADGYGVYMLDHSGAVVLSRENNWVTGADSLQWRQQNTNFTMLKSANGTNWLPYGWSETTAADGSYNLNATAEGSGKITQVGFNNDGTYDVYVQRQTKGAQGVVNTLYDIKFNAKGVTNNSVGTALTASAAFTKELASGLDINGDGFVGKPVLTLKTVLSSSAIFQNSGSDAWGSYASNTKSITAATQTNIISKYSLNQFTVGATGAYEGSINVYDKNLTFISSITTGTEVQIVTSGDFNKDGVGDFLAIDHINNQIVTYQGDDHGKFTPLQRLNIAFSDKLGGYGNFDPNRVSSHGVALDFNKDNLSDFVLLETNSIKTEYLGQDVVGIYKNIKGNLTLTDQINLGPSAYSGIESADLNKDGFMDLVLVGKGNDSIKLVFGGNVPNTFSTAGNFANYADLSGIYEPLQVRVADMNNDGKSDLVMLDNNSNGKKQIQIYLGAGGGEFTKAQTLITSSEWNQQTYSFNLQDLNNDGYMDITGPSLKDAVYFNTSMMVDGSGKFKVDNVLGVDVAFFENKAKALGLNEQITSFNVPTESSYITTGDFNVRDINHKFFNIDIWNSVPYVLQTNSNKFTMTLDAHGGNVPDVQIIGGTPYPDYNSSFIRLSNSDPIFKRIESTINGTGNALFAVQPGLNGEHYYFQNLGKAGEFNDKLHFTQPGSIQVMGTYTSGGFHDDPNSITHVMLAYKTQGAGVVTYLDVQIRPPYTNYSNYSYIHSVADLNAAFGFNLITLDKNLTESTNIDNSPTIGMDWRQQWILGKPEFPLSTDYVYSDNTGITYQIKNLSHDQELGAKLYTEGGQPKQGLFILDGFKSGNHLDFTELNQYILDHPKNPYLSINGTYQDPSNANQCMDATVVRASDITISAITDSQLGGILDVNIRTQFLPGVLSTDFDSVPDAYNHNSNVHIFLAGVPMEGIQNIHTVDDLNAWLGPDTIKGLLP